MATLTATDETARRYTWNHHLLAEGCFVLAGRESTRGGVATAFRDLFRLAGGCIVEH